MLLASLVTAANVMATSSLEPAPWPEVFHASMLKHRNGQVCDTDLYYDWPAGGNLHIDRRPEEKPFFDNERQNGSTYYYTPGGSCKVIEMGVGLLPPDWLKGATYGGNETVRTASDEIRCHVWTKGHAMDNSTGPFITYYENMETRTPARWRFFDGMYFDILHWEPGKKASAEQWQLPASCFNATVQSRHKDLDQTGKAAWLRSAAVMV